MKSTALFLALFLTAGHAEDAWQRFQIYDDTRLCNGLDAADVNKDGLTDYVTNFEDTGKVVVMLHPGHEDSTKPWPVVPIGRFDRVESSCFGDFDGDGFPDVAVAHGREDPEEIAGTSIVWHPGKDAVSDIGKWKNSELVPSSRELGNYLFVRAHDMDGDGAPDLVAGGRTEGHAGDQVKTEGHSSVGIRWFQAPLKQEDRRDMSRWSRHDIDTEIISGHGFEIADFNGDSLPDIALANADWGTPEDSKQVIWYEHPSEGTTWKKHVIYTNKEFYTKPGIIAEDFDGDGRPDLLTQLDDRILFFKNSDENGKVSFGDDRDSQNTGNHLAQPPARDRGPQRGREEGNRDRRDPPRWRSAENYRFHGRHVLFGRKTGSREFLHEGHQMGRRL